MERFRYEIRWTQKRGKAGLLPRRIIATCRQDAIRLLADALKENAGTLRRPPKRISITLGTKDKGPTRVKWMRV